MMARMAELGIICLVVVWTLGAAVNAEEAPILPACGFTENATTGDYPFAVQFTDTSLNATSYFWDFGDGNTSSSQNPVHTYTWAGTYTVSHGATNPNGTTWFNVSGDKTVTEPVTPAPTTPVPTVTPTPTPTGVPPDGEVTGDVEAYFGPLGPGSPLYGLKLALEDLDESFTFNASEKVIKQMEHAELRIAEIKGLLLMNKSDAAEQALDAYYDKMNYTAVDLARIPARTTGIANAYQQQVVHEMVLWDLLQKYPNSTHLARAYNKTLDLEDKFMEKSTIVIQKRIGELNKITAKIVKDADKETSKQVKKGKGAEPGTTQPTRPTPRDKEDKSGKGKEKEKNGKGPK